MYQPQQFGPSYAIEDMLIAYMQALGFEDISWGNNGCPSFYRGRPNKAGNEILVTLWIDAKHKQDREFPKATRFMLEVREEAVGPEMDPVLFETDDFWELLKRAREALNEYGFASIDMDINFPVPKADLAAVYKILVGYDPFEDDPQITQLSVARLIVEYLEEAMIQAIKPMEELV